MSRRRISTMLVENHFSVRSSPQGVPREESASMVVRLPRWVKYIDEQTLCAYWVNIVTGETTWKEPREDTVVEHEKNNGFSTRKPSFEAVNEPWVPNVPPPSNWNDSFDESNITHTSDEI
eukprot:CAMPEP_0170178080 /NCGR_PEP_ID=MMETSP0040_2-20121228/11654_1 /TAXON_ID=641309 /ORGANISM="Lotharella oceanica, Strain CCMP622" /LENGTH=119 /DNA_ID=CAMNT_0010421037 /DNA_START=117 /DNA_END=476 /DNA_ORIENTATION=+